MKSKNINKIKVLISSLMILSSIFIIISFMKNKGYIKDNNFSFHVIDVGQGDSLLLRVNGYNVLIDSGPSSSLDELIFYLDNLKIKKIDYLIATHPHEDHIGNMNEIIEKYDIVSFYSPKITSNTKTFEDMILALKYKSLKINVPKFGDTISLGKNASLTFYTDDNIETDNLNNYSPLIKIKYKNFSILSSSDAEKEIEEYILKKNVNLSADVFKAGHHGSKTSNSKEFLEAISPKFALVSLSKINSYGHPSEEVLERFKLLNITPVFTYNGTIVITSNGSTFEILQ